MANDDSTAHFDQIKLQNKKVVRSILRKEDALGVSQLSSKSGLSYPTVASLLKELETEKQVVISDKTESCGGRPGIRYEINTAYQYAFIMYEMDWQVVCNVYNAAGGLETTVKRDCDRTLKVEDICEIVRELKQQYNTVSAVAVGIPGTVFDGTITHLPKYPNLIGSELAQSLKSEFNVDVFIENDINAISFAEIGKKQCFAHVVFMDRCIGVGIVLSGEVIKGTRGYAGEFQYLVNNEKNTAQVFAQCILILISVLDLQDFIISSNSLNEDTPNEIMKILSGILPEARLPKIYVENSLEDKYMKGMLLRVMKKWEEEN